MVFCSVLSTVILTVLDLGLPEMQDCFRKLPAARGVLQGSCRDSRVFYAAIFSVGCSLSGLSVTAPMGCQFRVLLDQRCGF